ncbi:MAG: ribosome silencing factor [Bacteroidota bacterium]
MTARALAHLIANTMVSKKANDVVTMDLRKLTSTTDYFVVCSADSDTQVRAIAGAVEDATEEAGSPVWKSEGRQTLTWVILDFVDVVAHVFHRESRTFYNLERLWADAKTVAVTDDAEKPKAPARRTKSAGGAKPRRAAPKRRKPS